ncbi:asparagine synthase (glutamine-hydrolyzing) [Candidatus Woesearchaeota archaeon]|nr:asparagine synthase (glutamine-hydrolyzing) [Candidatus Woesearchaeota archaeon]
MCGINGVVGLSDKGLIKQMNKVVTHRGPDDEGFYLDKNIMLGHRRLSIIDLSEKGRQPIHDEHEDNHIIFNGEIYNYEALRNQLKKSHNFTTNTDTEVIVHAYEEWGIDCVKKFIGMFVFAIWNSRKKELFLARDRLGIKPLHYALTNGGVFLFASEIKSILQYEEVKPQLNGQALYNFLNINYTPGEQTFFKGIKRLRPGHTLLYKNGKISIQKYWDISVNITNHPDEYYIDMLRELLLTSVERRLISDVPFGAYLSGGMDSSTVVGMMSQLVGEPIKTYTVGFNEPWDELEDARRISEHFGTDHHELVVESKDMEKEYPKAIWHMDMPQRNIIPTIMVSRLAKKKVTVMQNGLGGDELFAGYRRHKWLVAAPNVSKWVPPILKKNVLEPLSRQQALPFDVRRGLKYLATAGEYEKNYVVLAPQVIFDEDLEQLAPDLASEATPIQDVVKPFFDPAFKHDFFNQALVMELKSYLCDDLLDRFDRVSMAASIEGRVPFLDHEVVEFSFTMPNHMKVRNNEGKYVLRQAIKELVPKEVLQKKKQGFNMNNYYWYNGYLGDLARQLLTKENLRESPLRYDYLQKIMQRRTSPRLFWEYAQVWNAVAIEIWRKMYLEGDLRKPRFDMKYYL